MTAFQWCERCEQRLDLCRCPSPTDPSTLNDLVEGCFLWSLISLFTVLMWAAIIWVLIVLFKHLVIYLGIPT